MTLHTTSDRQLGIILGFGTLIWSGTFSALAKGLTPYLSPVTLLLLSETLTALFIALTFGLVTLLKEFKKMDARSVWMAVIVGLLNSAIAPYLWYTGLSYTTAANASLLGSADVICVLMLGWFVLKERVSRMQVVGVLTVIIGIVIINVGPSSEPLGIHVGDALVILGAIASGVGAVLFKKTLSHVMPELAIFIRNVSAVAVVAVIGFLTAAPLHEEVVNFPLEQVLLLLSFAFFSRYLTLTFFYESLNRLPATTFSMIQIGAPLAGVVFAWLILGEQIHQYHILGGIFIVFGLFLEQVSAATLQRIGWRPFFTHWHFFHKKEVTPVTLVPKHV